MCESVRNKVLQVFYILVQFTNYHFPVNLRNNNNGNDIVKY